MLKIILKYSIFCKKGKEMSASITSFPLVYLQPHTAKEIHNLDIIPC
jgi:hypothetical protein